MEYLSTLKQGIILQNSIMTDKFKAKAQNSFNETQKMLENQLYGGNVTPMRPVDFSNIDVNSEQQDCVSVIQEQQF